MPDTIFAHAALNCQDPLRVERFYTRHLGFRRARVIPIDNGQQIVFIGNANNFYLELFPAATPSPLPRPEKDGYTFHGVRHLAFKVEDVDAKLAEMDAEARITLGPLNFDEVIPGWRTVWVADPEGNIVEISQGYVDQEAAPPLES
jgi:glyoxylase I family protein